MKKLSIFFAGLIAATLALILEIVFLIIFSPHSSEKLLTSLLTPIIVVALFEEFSKLTVMKKIFSTHFFPDVFLNALIFGAGFSATEIGLHFTRQNEFSGMAFLGFLGIALIHLTNSSFFAYFLKLQPAKLIYPIIAIGITSIIHFIFNILTFYNYSTLGIDLLLILLLFFIYRKMR